MLSKEQRSAKGNFPGPAPVIYYPHLSTADAAQIEAASEAGANAVVLTPSLVGLADAVLQKNMEVVWDVRSVGEIRALVDADKAAAGAFLMAGADAVEGGLLAALPQDAVGICSVDCENNEIELGRNLHKASGVKALVVRGSCIGDKEWDLPYSRFAIESLTSKANPKFQITGIGTNKGGGGDGRQSYGADSAGRQAQDRMSVQKDINHFHDKPGGTNFDKIKSRGTTF